MLHAVVLAGGTGSRLWPMSRAAVPKHLLPLAGGGRTLLRATLDRVRPLTANVWVVTVASQAQQCAAELAAAGLDPARVIAEPGARGTGPALGLAVSTIAEQDGDAVIASVHADHHIGDDEAYRVAVLAAAGWARGTGGLATVGVQPTEPATGLGYIEVGEPLPADLWRSPEGGGPGVVPLPGLRVDRFVEKPDLATALTYLAGGRHLWNTGLFAWEASTFLRELGAASPEIEAGVAATVAARAAGDEAAAATAYLALPSEAVDTLVLERTTRLTAVPAAFGWSDLGSWADLAGARRGAGDADAEGNVVEGDASLGAGTRNCLVDARGGRRVTVLGAEDLVVVDTGDAVLVLAAGVAQQVKQAVDALRAEGRTDLL